MAAALTPGQREAGILLHPTSLPSGQLDADTFRWLDWLAESGISVWQMLPLGIPLTELSPYQCASAFAVHPGLFPVAEAVKAEAEPAGFTEWYRQNQGWVDDFALFSALKIQFDGIEWMEWPAAYRRRDAATLAAFQQTHAAELANTVRAQFSYWQYWQTIRAYAHARGIRLFGDIPIFVAQDSADVWAHPEWFLIDANGHPSVVTGVPPDYFSETGQRWGNPHYNWDSMQADGFLWWNERLRYHFDFFDLVRIDHFRGLEAVWMIPADCETAIEGHWEPVPGDALLAHVAQNMGDLPLIAEDLGVITPEVRALRNKYRLPGMSVLQFAFDQFEDNPHKPQNVEENCVYYTGTHDNDTLLGWFDSLDEDYQSHIIDLLNSRSTLNERNITFLMTETLLASPAGLVMFPWQDLLELGSDARMNTPGTVVGNWQWQFTWAQVPDTLATDLRARLDSHQRLNPDSAGTNQTK